MRDPHTSPARDRLPRVWPLRTIGRGSFAIGLSSLLVSSIPALAQVTVPDPQFRVLTTLSGTSSVGAAVDADGRVLIHGSFDVVNGVIRNGSARLGPDGSTDPGFTFDPKAQPVVQPDGGVLLWYDKQIRRLHPDSTPDPTFEIHTWMTNIVDGVEVVTAGRIMAVRVEGDGRIWASGGFSAVNGVPRARVARVFPDGSVDPAFIPDLTADEASLDALLVQPDGKVVLARASGSYDPAMVPPLLRLNADGSLDREFQMPLGTPYKIRTLALRSNGNILVGGSFDRLAGLERAGLVELRPDGSAAMEANLGTGTPSTQFGWRVNEVLPVAEGGTLVGGWFSSFNGVERVGLVKLRADGTVDPLFDAQLRFGDPPSMAAVSNLLATPSGVVVTGWFESAFGVRRFGVLRLGWDGGLDMLYGPDIGLQSQPSVAILPGHRVLVAGSFNRVNGTDAQGICRLLPDGRLDSSFHASLKGVPTTGDFPCLILAHTNGMIGLAGSFTNVNGTPRKHLALLREDGGLATNTFPSLSAPVTAWAKDREGRLLVAADGTVRRVLTNGLLDFGFRQVGYSGTVVALVPESNGSTIVVRDRGITATNLLMRLHANGERDTSYNPMTSFRSGPFYCAAGQPDGSLLIGGGFFIAGGDPVQSNKVARLRPDGTLDASFRPDRLPGLRTVNFLQLEPGGRIVVGCRRSLTSQSLARLNPDGSLDLTFQIPSSPGTILSGLALAPDGRESFVAGSSLGPPGAPPITVGRLASLPDAVLSCGLSGGGGGPILKVAGRLGERHRIEFSEDFEHWSPLGVIAADCMPPCEIELDADAATHRFYRAVLLP